ncbi:HEAT repeat domain-containing protein [Streptacidiphilus sp. EB103A]|uniref:HEAT repeat domain-containing protein n=1 Tax=Streptacidiphilus sp. EB103A TaxID=3156275 RepID=UPI0035169C40
MNDSSDGFRYAQPATLQGQLERGRGLGAQRAPHAPGAAELVYSCVLTDSRWDRQTEYRDSYLTRLIHRMDLPLGPIEDHLLGHRGSDAEEIELSLQVLALLPFLGRLDAVPVLRRYAASGIHWAAAIEAIEWTGSLKLAAVWDGLDRDVLAGHDDAALAAELDNGEPWTSWARTQPRIRRLLRERAASRPVLPARAGRAATDHAGSSTAELSKRVAAGPGPERRRALEELGQRGDPIVLDLAEDPSLRNAAAWTPGLPQALHHLRTTAVPRARTWIGHRDDTLDRLARRVLSEFGEHEDAPYLLNALTTATEGGNWCAAEVPARGLGRLHVTAAAEPLMHLWEATEHSSAREAILAGLSGCAPETAALCAMEGLDDCEPSVQRTALTLLPNTPAARTRLIQLRDDPLAPEARESAQAALGRPVDSGGEQ